jgi:hypothetical protein
MKMCVVCGEEKQDSEFPEVLKKDMFSEDECKRCRHIKSQKIHRDSIRKNINRYTSEKKKACDRAKRVRACAKKFCPSIEAENVVKLKCPVCGVMFGVTKAIYNGTFNYFGRPPRYCSRGCYYISLTKKWQQKDSSYAKRITEAKARASAK